MTLSDLKSRINTPPMMIAAGSIMISFSAVFVKLTATGPTIDGFYRMFFGGLGLLIIGLLRRERFFSTPLAFGFAALAGLLFGTDLSFWHRSIQTIGPGLATIIVNLQILPLAVLGALVYGDHLDYRFKLAIPTALLGMYLLIGQEWQGYSDFYKWGLIQSFIALVCYSCYTIALRKSQTIPEKINAVPNLAIVCLVGAAILGLIAYGRGESFMAESLQDWCWLGLYGIFGQIFGWLLISKGLSEMSISRAGLLLLLQPALSLTWDILFFGRMTTGIEFLGTFITLAAIYFGSTSRRQKSARVANSTASD